MGHLYHGYVSHNQRVTVDHGKKTVFWISWCDQPSHMWCPAIRPTGFCNLANPSLVGFGRLWGCYDFAINHIIYIYIILYVWILYNLSTMLRLHKPYSICWPHIIRPVEVFFSCGVARRRWKLVGDPCVRPSISQVHCWLALWISAVLCHLQLKC